MHGLRVIDGGGHYSFDLVGFYDLFYRHFLIWKKNSFCVKKILLFGNFLFGKKQFFNSYFSPPPRKERLVILHRYHVF